MNISVFLERYAEARFRFSSELLPLLLAGRAKYSVSPVNTARSLQSTYELRARSIEQRTSEYWRSLHRATVELCEALRAAPERQVQIWFFDSGDTTSDFRYLVFEASDPSAILGCLRFPMVVSFPAERVTPHRVRVRAGAAEFRRRAGALISRQGRVPFSFFTNDGVDTPVDAELEIETGTDFLWLTLPFQLGGNGDVLVTVRADQAERREPPSGRVDAV